MRRYRTGALLGALVALAVAAAVDALRGDADGPRQEPASAQAGRQAGVTADELAEARVRGVLYYTAASDCRLRAVALPSLRPARAPDWRLCPFSLSPDGRVAAEGRAVWEPDGRFFAVPVAGGIDLFARTREFLHRIAPATAPAFKPDGTLTYVRQGALLELACACKRRPCVAPVLLAGTAPRCPRTVLTAQRLLRALAAPPARRGARASLERVAWLDERRVVALAKTNGVFGSEAEALVVFDTRQPRRARVWDVGAEYGHVEASARRRYVTVSVGRRSVAVFGRAGALGAAPTALAPFAWSPDDAWIASVRGGDVAFYRAGAGISTLRELPLDATDIAWR